MKYDILRLRQLMNVCESYLIPFFACASPGHCFASHCASSIFDVLIELPGCLNMMEQTGNAFGTRCNAIASQSNYRIRRQNGSTFSIRSPARPGWIEIEAIFCFMFHRKRVVTPDTVRKHSNGAHAVQYMCVIVQVIAKSVHYLLCVFLFIKNITASRCCTRT